jgi:hypothetical protein
MVSILLIGVVAVIGIALVGILVVLAKRGDQ